MRVSAAPHVVGGRLSFAPTLRRRGPYFRSAKAPGLWLRVPETAGADPTCSLESRCKRRPVTALVERCRNTFGPGGGNGYDGSTMDLFSERAERLADQDAPLAARMRPREPGGVVGPGRVG